MQLLKLILRYIIHKYLSYSRLLEKFNIENLQDSGQTVPKPQFFFDGRDSLCSASATPSLRKANDSHKVLQLTPNTRHKMVLTTGRG
jgi:hypothetical protein